MKRFKDNILEWARQKMMLLNAPLVNMVEYISKREYLVDSAINCNAPGVSNERYCNNEIIVSLTTYNRRLYEVYLAIESLMRQTLKPNRIVLWLADELKNGTLPLLLQKQQKRGLEIRYCKDIRSYKKLIPALQAFPDAVIITTDDDAFYNLDLLENLVNAYIKSPSFIHGSRIHRMKLNSSKSLKKYSEWIRNWKYLDVSPLNFPIGVGGVLYPPHCFNEEVFNENIFMDICKYADDVWFKAMALLNGTITQKTCYSNTYITNENIQDTGLQNINVVKKMNDIQLKAVFDKYNLYDKLLINNKTF